ncbi:MAG: hypothetical protein JSV33_09205 [bacterium]|nr:MAG: hypothetical protein JSV33_09205 [bacterium]
MIGSRIRTIMVLLVLICITLSACRSSIRYTHTVNPKVKAKHSGPPPHAPAHGYRHKHSDGVELVYNSNIGVYVVAGHSELYYCRDKYYRLNGGSWEVSSHVKGKWAPVSHKQLPPGLRKKNKSKKGK